MFWIGRDGNESLGRGGEQQAIDLGLVLIRDGADLRRQGEHHMIIGDWQQLGFARREPLGGGSPLAFGTMPVAAGNGRRPLAALWANPVMGSWRAGVGIFR